MHNIGRVIRGAVELGERTFQSGVQTGRLGMTHQVRHYSEGAALGADLTARGVDFAALSDYYSLGSPEDGDLSGHVATALSTEPKVYTEEEFQKKLEQERKKWEESSSKGTEGSRKSSRFTDWAAVATIGLLTSIAIGGARHAFASAETAERILKNPDEYHPDEVNWAKGHTEKMEGTDAKKRLLDGMKQTFIEETVWKMRDVHSIGTKIVSLAGETIQNNPEGFNRIISGDHDILGGAS